MWVLPSNPFDNSSIKPINCVSQDLFGRARVSLSVCTNNSKPPKKDFRNYLMSVTIYKKRPIYIIYMALGLQKPIYMSGERQHIGRIIDSAFNDYCHLYLIVYLSGI